MLENLGFFHILSKNPVDADIGNRKHYSAPAGAVTMFYPSIPMSVLPGNEMSKIWLPPKKTSHSWLQKKGVVLLIWRNPKQPPGMYETL